MFEVKQTFGPLSTGPITQDMIDQYADASFDHNPIHLDRKAAQSAGFDRQIVHGMLSMGKTYAILTEAFDRVGKITQYDIKFNAPLLVDESLDITATVRKVTDSSVRFAVEAYNSDTKDLVIKGTMTIDF